MTAPEPDLDNFLQEFGLAGPGESCRWTPLNGGVSSDIWRVETPAACFCVKRARAQLKVAAEWTAPIDRNAYEWAYLQVVNAIAPGSVPRPYAHDPGRGLFAMEWLPPGEFALWKAELLEGRARPAFAASVGGLLGRIHAASTRDITIASRFASDANFHALRIDPYLLEAARVHLDLASRLEQIAEKTFTTRRVLVHGDVSPKNILIGAAGPLLLDAEVAWFGDPAFDVAFCLTHLVAKARVIPRARIDLLECTDRFVDEYIQHVDWESPADLEARAAALLPALALARVDGKSPLEYLADRERSDLRHLARQGLRTEVADIRQMVHLLS